MTAPRPARLALIAVVLAALAGCFARGSSSSEMADDADIFTVLVNNHHPLNVTIYNVAQGHRERIGEVTAASNERFRLHTRRFPANEIQLYGDAVGSNATVKAELMRVEPGDQLEWTLESDLSRSMLIRR